MFTYQNRRITTNPTFNPSKPAAGGTLLPEGRGFHRGPPHRLPTVHDPRPPREKGGEGVPRTVELDRATSGGLADTSLPPRDAPLQQGPPLRLPG